MKLNIGLHKYIEFSPLGVIEEDEKFIFFMENIQV
jgi:hypothetical protein